MDKQTNTKMDWARLIDDCRFGLEDYHKPRTVGVGRSDFRRDYDRLVFSSPFRRLQNKTQVFPLPGSVFVHNRLTHSLEVSSVGRSMADEIAAALVNRHGPMDGIFADLGDVVAAACLAHDLGNPPFGHSGEKAIGTFFSEGAGRVLKDRLTPGQWSDIVNFEGNANALRALTHQFNGRRPGGFAMTYTMLASIVKYPYDSSQAGAKGKFGFFGSERADFERIATRLGMLRMPSPEGSLRFCRHPLVYVVESADDICYEVMDFEDAHKLKILGTEEVLDALLAYFDDESRAHVLDVMKHVKDPNEKISYLRSGVVGRLVSCCARTFMDNEDAILSGTFEGALLDHIREREREAYRRSTRLSWGKIYGAPQVVDIELAGNRILTFLLEKMIHAVTYPELNYSRLLLSQVPGQYNVGAPELFDRIQAVLDHISAMTDVYALDLYRKLNGMSLPAV